MAKAKPAQSPGAALAALRWKNATEAERDQPRKAGKLGGRPRLPRCKCGAMTAQRALARGHHC